MKNNRSNLSKDTTKKFKLTKSLAITSIAASGLLIISVGFLTGSILKRELLGQTEIDYTGFNPNDYKMDAKGLLKEFNRNPNKSFTAAELVNIGLEKYRQCDNCYSIGLGVASTIVDQSIRNAQIKVGDHYFEESISYSKMVAVANRSSQVGENSQVNINLGKATSADNATYKSEEKTYSHDDYKNTWGKTLDEMFIYLISNKTVLEGSSIEKDDEHIKVTVKLNPDLATYYYKIQMKKISSLDKLPTFDYLTHIYTFSKDMMLERCYVDEGYKASMGVTATIHNKINYYYYANKRIDIPQINETVDYSLKGENDYE